MKSTPGYQKSDSASTNTSTGPVFMVYGLVWLQFSSIFGMEDQKTYYKHAPGQNYFWPARNISGRPEIFLAGQKFFWLVRNISHRPEIFLASQNISGWPEIFLTGQKYFWLARNISGRSERDPWRPRGLKQKGSLINNKIP